MKIKKIRIKNFRSIKNVFNWDINDEKIEVLVGKNSIGKSAIIDSLLYFNREMKILDNNDKPNFSLNKESELSIVLELSKTELEKLDINLMKFFSRKKKLTLNGKSESNIVKFSKIFPPGKEYYYKINEKGLNEFIFMDIQDIKEIIKSYKSKYNFHQYTIIKSEEPIPDEKVLKHDLSAIKNLCHKIIREKHSKVSDDDFSKIIEIISKIENYQNRISGILPIFIKYEFSTYGQLNNEIYYDDAIPAKEIARHLFNAMRLDYKQFILNKGQYHIIETLSKARNPGFEEFLTQNWFEKISKIEMKFYPQYMVCSIDDGHISTKLSQRSFGERWLFSFLLFLFYYSRLNENIVILIDEPSINLHPNAQMSILKELQTTINRFKNLYIFYTTHSPYLVPKNHLNLVSRVVRSRNRGTEIIKFDYQKLLIYVNERLTRSTATLNTIQARQSQMFTISLRETFFATGVILCEGYTESLSLPIWSEILNYNLYDNGIVVLQISKFDMINYAEFLLVYEIPFFLIFDNDSNKIDPKEKKQHVEHNRWFMKITGGLIEDFPKGYSNKYFVFSPNYEASLRKADSEYIKIEAEVSRLFGTGKKKGIRARYVALMYKELNQHPPQPIIDLINSIKNFKNSIDKEL